LPPHRYKNNEREDFEENENIIGPSSFHNPPDIQHEDDQEHDPDEDNETGHRWDVEGIQETTCKADGHGTGPDDIIGGLQPSHDEPPESPEGLVGVDKEPPDSVMNEESSAAESAVKRATNPAMMKERMTEGPAIPDATPIRTKIPAPMIAPMLTEAADQTRVFSSVRPCPEHSHRDILGYRHEREFAVW
jgi:hypothetical protein